jgi:hypothetical protein
LIVGNKDKAFEKRISRRGIETGKVRGEVEGMMSSGKLEKAASKEGSTAGAIKQKGPT